MGFLVVVVVLVQDRQVISALICPADWWGDALHYSSMALASLGPAVIPARQMERPACSWSGSHVRVARRTRRLLVIGFFSRIDPAAKYSSAGAFVITSLSFIHGIDIAG